MHMPQDAMQISQDGCGDSPRNSSTERAVKPIASSAAATGDTPSSGSEIDSSPVESRPPWSFATRLGFRFVFSWLVLLIEPFPFYLMPGLRWIAWLLDKVLGKPFNWTSRLAARLMQYSGPLEMPFNGSTDRTVDWVAAFACLILAAIITAIWCTLDRRPRRHDRLYIFLRIYVRYWLASSMFFYGSYKLFLVQMPVPTLARLEEPFGDASPMGLLWTLMGASPAYERFTGLVELAGCVLLLWSRTALLGAVTVVGVMLNVVMFNLCYDVPVKIYSSTLLLTALFLCLNDAPRLVAVLRGHAVAVQARWSAPSRRWRVTLAALEVAAAVGLLGQRSWDFYQFRGQTVAPLTPLPFEGRWRIERQVLDGNELPAQLTENARWQTVYLSRYKRNVYLYARRVDETPVHWYAELDENKHTLHFTSPEAKSVPTLTYAIQDSEHVTFSDPKQQWVLTLRKLPPRSYLLVTRGFHWINEEPFNR
jgi:hypothetical protein